MVRIFTDGPPTHPGEMLLEELLKPLGMTQAGLAEKIGVSYPRVDELVRGKWGVTPDTALRLQKAFWDGSAILAQSSAGLGSIPRGSFPRSQENPQDQAPVLPRDSRNPSITVEPRFSPPFMKSSLARFFQT
jgi:addiction module HigA family antidote